MSACAAGVVVSECTMPRVSVPTWIFMPKYHCCPLRVCCISGSRVFVAFFVELGAAMIVASTMVPAFSSKRFSVNSAFTASNIAGHFEVRRISTAGTFRLHNGQQFFTQALNGEMIGLEGVHDGLWNVLYYDTLLGRFDERTRTITGAPSLKKDC